MNEAEGRKSEDDSKGGVYMVISIIVLLSSVDGHPLGARQQIERLTLAFNGRVSYRSISHINRTGKSRSLAAGSPYPVPLRPVF